MRSTLKALQITILVGYTLCAGADVLYNGTKAVALGKGTRERKTIHWTYCDGKTEDFKMPPHKFVRGEHCTIQPYVFGLIEKEGKYLVQNEDVFDKFFQGSRKGDVVKFSSDSKSVQMYYNGEDLTIYCSPPDDHKD